MFRQSYLIHGAISSFQMIQGTASFVLELFYFWVEFFFVLREKNFYLSIAYNINFIGIEIESKKMNSNNYTKKKTKLINKLKRKKKNK